MSESNAQETSPDNIIKLKDHFETAEDLQAEVEEETLKLRYGILGRLDEWLMNAEQLSECVNAKRLEVANQAKPQVVENSNVIPMQKGIQKAA